MIFRIGSGSLNTTLIFIGIMDKEDKGSVIIFSDNLNKIKHKIVGLAVDDEMKPFSSHTSFDTMSTSLQYREFFCETLWNTMKEKNNWEKAKKDREKNAQNVFFFFIIFTFIHITKASNKKYYYSSLWYKCIYTYTNTFVAFSYGILDVPHTNTSDLRKGSQNFVHFGYSNCKKPSLS